MANGEMTVGRITFLDGGSGLEQLKVFSIVIVGFGLAFQVGHFAEHAVQFAVWLFGTSQWVTANFCGRNIPYMSGPVMKAVSVAGAYLFPSADVARQTMMGAEILHLAGNSLFLATIAGVFYFIPGKLVRYAFYIEAAHLCEHISLTLSAYYAGTPIGVSTLFGQAPILWGKEATVGWRVSWHFAMNLLPMPFVIIAVIRDLTEWDRETTALQASATVKTARRARVPEQGNPTGLPSNLRAKLSFDKSAWVPRGAACRLLDICLF
jgi:hypothetical protein